MRTKQGVSVRGVAPELVFASLICESVFNEAGQKFTLTSVCDGRHKVNSLHYVGKAFDIRVYDLRGISSYVMASRLQEALGSEFQVIVEPDHIHVEFDLEKTPEDEIRSLQKAL